VSYTHGDEIVEFARRGWSVQKQGIRELEGWSSAGSGEIPGSLLFVLSWLVQDARLSQKSLFGILVSAYAESSAIWER